MDSNPGAGGQQFADINKTFQDFMGCNQNKQILDQLESSKGEKVIFSCAVVKINRFGMKQERTLLLTNMNLYNIKKDSIQRRIGVDSIKSITKSTKGTSTEFVVHVKSEYDYRFESEYRNDIFDAIKYVCWKHNKANLPVYAVPDRLKDFHTSKRDISEGNEIDPDEKFRVKAEDCYPEDASIASTASGGSFPGLGAGSSAQTADNFLGVGNNNKYGGGGGFDEMQAQNAEIAKMRSNTLFQRQPQEKAAELKDFIIKSVIGKGSFGKVFLVQKVDTGGVYAMKSLRKDVILDYDQIESTLLEKEILQKADHPFLVGMEYVFQTDQKIFFVMKFVRGGELFMHLRKTRQFSEQRAKFYSLTVALALGHLHKQKIIYRDLKPENILMGEDGYVCLTDFGLAKILQADEQAHSFCGTPEYLAPEILEEIGHAFPVDWWALGILTYEMIVGFPPFYTGQPNNNKMYELIKTKPVFFPDARKHGIAMSENCKDFINSCLQKDPKKRIGLSGGIDEIIQHPWFADIDVSALLNKQIQPEFKPKLSNNVFDVTNFDKMFTSDEAVHSVLPQNAQRKIQKHTDKFSGFDA